MKEKRSMEKWPLNFCLPRMKLAGEKHHFLSGVQIPSDRRKFLLFGCTLSWLSTQSWMQMDTSTRMKILVTGSAGYLGNALCVRLKEEGHEVVGVDILTNATTDMTGNISDRNFVASKLIIMCLSKTPFSECLSSGVDSIIHTAALHRPHIEHRSNQDFIDTNVTGTMWIQLCFFWTITGTNNLLEEAVKKGIKRFLFTSSTSVFGHALKDNNSLSFEKNFISDCHRGDMDHWRCDSNSKEHLWNHQISCRTFMPTIS